MEGMGDKDNEVFSRCKQATSKETRESMRTIVQSTRLRPKSIAVEDSQAAHAGRIGVACSHRAYIGDGDCGLLECGKAALTGT